MTATLQLLLILSIIIFAAKSAGLISSRLGQPAVLGELIVGLALGPTLLDVLHLSIFTGSHMGDIIFELGELGVIFLMFIAGYEVDLEGMLESGRVAIWAGVFGVIVPLVLGAGVALVFNYPLIPSIFIGLILTATSVSISAQTLMEMGMLRSKEGLALLGAAVIDDILVILVLSIFLAVAGDTGAGAADVITIILRMVFFLGVAIAFGIFLIPQLVTRVDELPISQGIVAFVMIVTMLYAWSAEVIGQIAAITGSFLAGVFFARTPLRRKIDEGMHTITYAFFVPIFLISIGLKANARTLQADEVVFALAIIVVAIIAKVLGSGLGARIGGFDSRGSLRVGVGMISRGEVGLIVAGLGLQSAIISQNIFSVMVVMVLVSTIVTPIFLRLVFPQQEEKNGKSASTSAG